jgi:hypothetical protein
MRLWSGALLGSGEDAAGPAIFIKGEEGTISPVTKTSWKLEIKKVDGTRIWRPVVKGKLEFVLAPCPDHFSDKIKQAISEIPPVALHPAITNGMDKEALRLYPQLDPSVVTLFTSLVVYLRSEFQLNEAQMQTMPAEAYVDGFGPSLLVTLNGEPLLLPEIPPVWLAPSNWAQATWHVTNGMTGPNVDESMEPRHRLQFAAGISQMDLQTEGLVYYQAARAMIAWAAWENDTKARFVHAIASIIMSGYRPLASSDN